MKKPPLIIVTWLWKTTGWRSGYNAENVNAMEAMLTKYLNTPHEMICVTDMPSGINCRTIELWDEPVVKRSTGPNCYRRLKLFSPEIYKTLNVPKNSRLCSIDLDAILIRSIDHLFDNSHEFIIKEGRACPYNGSLWMISTGARPQVWQDFDIRTSPIQALNQVNPATGKNFYGSDQAWISYKIPNEEKWTAFNHGVLDYFSDIRYHNNIANNGCVIFFPGALKPWDKEMELERPDIYNHYMGFYNNAPEKKT